MTEYPRELTSIERSMLEFLLSGDFPGVVEYRSQVASMVVTDRCACGCLDLDLSVSPDAPLADDAGYSISAWSEQQQIDLALETLAGRLMGVRLMWFGDEARRIDPDFSTFEITMSTPEDRRPVRAPWGRRVRTYFARQHPRHRTTPRT